MIDLATPTVKLITIGGSAGSLDVLHQILPFHRGAGCPPIAVVVHQPANGPALLHEVLAEGASLKLKQAEDKEPLLPDHVYFAPPGYHLLIERDLSVALSVDPPVQYSRPSIDVLFDSAAMACGDSLLAVLLTGASEDGAAGMLQVDALGGLCAIQTPESATAPYMPASALRRLPSPQYLLAPSELGRLLQTVQQALS